MNQTTEYRIETYIKLFGVVVVLAGGIWTLFQYVDARRHETELQSQLRRRETDAFLFRKQADLYFEAAANAATIASSTDSKTRKKAEERFNQLYWGELVMVEDRRVELAMINFKDCLDKKNKNCSLDAKSLDLAACARDSIVRTWNTTFGPPSEHERKKSVCPYA